MGTEPRVITARVAAVSDPVAATVPAFDSADYELCWPRDLFARELAALRAGPDSTARRQRIEFLLDGAFLGDTPLQDFQAHAQFLDDPWFPGFLDLLADRAPVLRSITSPARTGRPGTGTSATRQDPGGSPPSTASPPSSATCGRGAISSGHSRSYASTTTTPPPSTPRRSSPSDSAYPAFGRCTRPTGMRTPSSAHRSLPRPGCAASGAQLPQLRGAVAGTTAPSLPTLGERCTGGSQPAPGRQRDRAAAG